MSYFHYVGCFRNSALGRER